MNVRFTLCLLMALILTGCYTDDFFEVNKDAFYKLYGNGTYQEAVEMHLTVDGDILILGNQAVRNQDSSAVLLIRANAEGNQLWSKKLYGKGHTLAKCLVVLPNGELLVLGSSRAQDNQISMPVFYRINGEGELLAEHFIEQNQATSTGVSHEPEDMVLGEEGTFFMLGNRVGVNGVSQGSFIKKVVIGSGEVADEREFNDSEISEAKSILSNGKHLLVLGNIGEFKSKRIFMGAYTENLVEANLELPGSSNEGTFKKAILSSRNEFIVLSNEKDSVSAEPGGVLRFVSPRTLKVRQKISLNPAAGEIPEAIEEDENGEFYLAVNAVTETGNTNIRISKIDAAGISLWESPREIGGEGDDRIAQLNIRDNFVYLLKTVDMQNENTLISLSKIRF